MNSGLVWSNVLAYSLQIGLLVGLGTLTPVVLRIRVRRARLLYWQVLLVACLALPWIRSWRQEVLTSTIQMTTVFTAVSPASSPLARTTWPLITIALLLLAAGIAIRLGYLATGIFRLGAYRRRGQELPRELRMPGASVRATLMLSDDVAGPVTFGWREPVILLPADFPSLTEEMRDAIVCHELLHVERQDWLFTIGEELLRSVLWFHPAVWWVIGEIQLAREQTVDQSVIEMTQAREPYVDALLLMAGVSDAGATQMDLAPAPMFLRKRHLKRRLLEVVKEVSMTAISKTRLTCLMSAAIAMVAAGCWLVTGVFPLSAAPQLVNDANGVAVNTNGSPLMHRSSVPYPAEALAKGIEGTVVVQMKLDANGEVVDATILSGPDELRKGVLQAVLAWHFDRSVASTTRTANINFAKPAGAQTAVIRNVVSPATPAQQAPARAIAPSTAKIDRVTVSGLSEQSRDELLSKIPVHSGDDWSPQTLSAVNEVSKAFDSHLTTTVARDSTGGFEIRLSAPNSGMLSPAPLTFIGGTGSGGGIGNAAIARPFAELPPGVFSVGNGISPPSVTSRVDPQYSEQARAAKYSGSVMLSIVVGTDGKADDIQVIKSLGMGLDEKAVEAVQQWAFRPGMNKGVPVKVRAQIEVNFRLLDKD